VKRIERIDTVIKLVKLNNESLVSSNDSLPEYGQWRWC